MSGSTFVRPQARQVLLRLREPRLHLQVLAGARQVGKTTLVLQVIGAVGLPHRYATADEPSLRGDGVPVGEFLSTPVEAWFPR